MSYLELLFKRAPFYLTIAHLDANLAAGSQAWANACSFAHSTNTARGQDYSTRRGDVYSSTDAADSVGENIAANTGCATDFSYLILYLSYCDSHLRSRDRRFRLDQRESLLDLCRHHWLLYAAYILPMVALISPRS